MAARLSLTMIVRDEEALLGRVLRDAAGFCDEMVVVDTGSRDRTRRIAREAGARVLDVGWDDDFAAARNVSLDACTGDWVLWLDADDVVPPGVQAALRGAKQEILTGELDAVTTPYHYAFDADTGACLHTFPRERLARRVAGLRWTGAVHEFLDIPGNRVLYRADLAVEHRPDPAKRAAKSSRNLRIIERMVREGDHSSRTRYYHACELRDAGRHAEALDAYTAYFRNPGKEWEQYTARLSAAECAGKLGRTGEAAEQLHAALRLDPSRAEAFLRLGLPHFERGEWAKALPFYAAASTVETPVTGFVSPPDYGWRPWDYLSVCLARLGRHEDSIAAAVTSLEAGNPERERLLANIRWSADRLPRRQE
ncbi:glycosyltransferase [Amycolatopsis sp. NPDC059021]|uniref:glycosyltransferase n=1 Tax=Amycolatopsis sp. NPDC059021 TaxID=3346704 RepID=UPI00367080FE